jgi:SagB-type dehydrogenase family enzyme
MIYNKFTFSSAIKAVTPLKDIKEFKRRSSSEAVSINGLGNSFFKNLDPELIMTAEKSDAPLSVIPTATVEFDCSNHFRKRSVKTYDKNLDSESLKSLIQNTLLTNEEGQFPYPSAGSLYPVKTFMIIQEQIGSFKKGVYVIHGRDRQAEYVGDIEIEYLTYALSDDSLNNSVIFAYLADMYISTFKYSTKGIKHAYMEAGAIYQRMSDECASLQLNTYVSSKFSDTALLKLLNANPNVFAPMVIQYVGK